MMLRTRSRTEGLVTAEAVRIGRKPSPSLVAARRDVELRACVYPPGPAGDLWPDLTFSSQDD
jgi:hypothetical protein